MKVIPLGKAKIIMQNPDSVHNYFAWPSAARLHDGRIAVVASGYRLAHVCPFGKTVISYSSDEGETYTPPAPIIDTPLDNRDGGVNTFGERGVVVSSLSLPLEFVKDALTSTLEHKTDLAEYASAYIESIPVDIRKKYEPTMFRLSHDGGNSFGELHTIPVSSPHGPVECRDGSLIWVGTLKTSLDEAAGLEGGIYAYRVNSESGEYKRLGKIPQSGENKRYHFCEPYAIELDSGRILCHIRAQVKEGGVFTLLQSVSDDGGLSWSEPEMIIGITGGAPAHIMKHSSGALISTYGYRCEPYGVKAMFSYDGGESWDTDHDVYIHDIKPTEEERLRALKDCSLISGVHGDIGYPATVELRDGSLLTVFYAHPTKDSPALIFQQKWRFEK